MFYKTPRFIDAQKKLEVVKKENRSFYRFILVTA
jgi:hypothetical protein